MSAMAFVVGIAFICIGIFVAIPQGGLFGIFWTIAAAGITIYHAVNLFSSTGVAAGLIDVDSSAVSAANREEPPSVEERLQNLDRLLSSGLVSRAEYEDQRTRILKEL